MRKYQSSFKKLIVWQESHSLTLAIYSETRLFPREEKYGLTSQLRRAAFSISANIAEGRSRKSKKEYMYFLNIARGSLCETEYFILLAKDLGYLKPSSYENLETQRKKVGYLLYRLIRKTKQ